MCVCVYVCVSVCVCLCMCAYVCVVVCVPYIYIYRAALRVKEAAWKSVLAASDEEIKERCMGYGSVQRGEEKG